MYRRLVILLVSIALAFIGAVVLDASPSAKAASQQPHQRVGGDRDCGDFSTQAAAQNFFLNNGGPDQDPHGLDADGDGIACESNPCPCNYDTGGGGGGGGGGGDDPEPRTLRQKAFVIRVIDGDTVKVKLKGGPRRVVRILGIDTPELSGSECGSLYAKQSARQLMPRGSFVLLISDTTQARVDRYNRLLRYVHKRSGFDVGKGQLRRGWAKVFVFNNNPFKRVASYRQAQAEARSANRGIWGLC